MPIRPCPSCEAHTTHWLGAASDTCWVNYYRCETCGCAWTIPKGDPDATRTVIFDGRKPGPHYFGMEITGK